MRYSMYFRQDNYNLDERINVIYLYAECVVILNIIGLVVVAGLGS